ncbi:MAG: hypothetical protein AAGJ74_13140 [Pseudomonadota bacterium]
MTTTTNTLLHAIWTGEVAAVLPHQKHKFFDLLTVLLKTQVVLIEVPEGPLCGQVLQETAELMPDLPLGDVLAEELDLDIPAGSVVVCLSANGLGATGDLPTVWKALGAVAAQMIVDVVQLADAPFADERGEMRRIADLLLSVVCRLAGEQFSVETSLFKTAMARAFAAALEGRATRHLADEVVTARFLPEMLSPSPTADLLDMLMLTGASGAPHAPLAQDMARRV